MDCNIQFVLREEIQTVGHPVWRAAGDTFVNTHGGGATSY